MIKLSSFLVWFICFFSLISCVSNNTQNIENFDVSKTLDIVIETASVDLIDNLPKGSHVVLVNVSGNETELIEYIIEELGIYLTNSSNIIVLERNNLEIIRIEQRLQISGEVSDTEIVSIGQFNGADTVISCNITGSGKLRRLRIKALDQKTASIQSNNSYEIINIQDYIVFSEEKQNISRILRSGFYRLAYGDGLFEIKPIDNSRGQLIRSINVSGDPYYLEMIIDTGEYLINGDNLILTLRMNNENILTGELTEYHIYENYKIIDDKSFFNNSEMWHWFKY